MQKFLCHVMRVRLLVPGRETFRNLSRYSPYHEKTFARWFARDVDFVSLSETRPGKRLLYAHRGLHLSPSLLPMSVQRIGSLYYYHIRNFVPPRQSRRDIP